MRALCDKVGRFVRGADGALYRVTPSRAAIVLDEPEQEPSDFGQQATDVPLWSDLDNSSARTFIVPKGH